LSELDVDHFNPRKEEWNPKDALTESLELARDRVLCIPILDDTEAHAAMAETGFSSLGGILRGQNVHNYIENGDRFDEKTRRARFMTNILMQKTVESFPINMKIADSLDDLIRSSVEGIFEKTKMNLSFVEARTSYTIRRTELEPTIALVGSGADSYANSWYDGMMRRLVNDDIPKEAIYSAFKANWHPDMATPELEHKTRDAVVLSVISADQTSYGAMGELGWQFAYCALNNQRLGIYMESYNDSPKSAPNRQRILAMAHVTRLLQDFPDLPVFIAETPKQLATYGASEFLKFRQQKRARNELVEA
jgi:hypothetical protein